MNIKTFFSKVFLAAAFVFLTISVALATEVDVTVKVTGNGTVSYDNKSASDGQSFTFSAALSYYELEPVFVLHSNLLSFSITHPAGYIVVVEAKKGSQNDNTDYTDETTYSYSMPFESDAISSVTLNFTFVELFRGGTESSPVILSDNTVKCLAGGWYKVENDITFDHEICSFGDTYLTIATGVTMKIDTEDKSGLLAAKKGCKLTISGEGTLSINSALDDDYSAINDFSYEQLSGNVVLTSSRGISNDNCDVKVIGGILNCSGAINVAGEGSITISGGIVMIENNYLCCNRNISITGGKVNVPDITGASVSITGGQVTVEDKIKNESINPIILGCTSATDFIMVNSFELYYSSDKALSITEKQTLTDGENLYSGILTEEQIAAIAGKKLVGVSYKITDEDGKKTVSLNDNGAFLKISSEMKVDQLTIERTFTYNTPSSVMFPLSFDASDVDGNFYTLDEVVFENGVWTAKMAGPITQIAANTPYIFKLKDGIDKIDNLTFHNVTLQPTTTINTNGSESDWTLHGVYTTTYFDELPGVCYGFAGVDAPEQGISEGQFIRAGEGSWVNPMRCYLTYNKNNGVFAKSAPDLPDYIRVVFPDEVEESESGEIVTPVSSLSETTGVKVWSSNRTIFIDAQPDTDYTIVDLSGRVLNTGITHSTREEIILSATGIVIVKIGKQTFKIIL